MWMAILELNLQKRLASLFQTIYSRRVPVTVEIDTINKHDDVYIVKGKYKPATSFKRKYMFEAMINTDLSVKSVKILREIRWKHVAKI